MYSAVIMYIDSKSQIYIIEEHLASVQTLSITNEMNFILTEEPQCLNLTDPTTRLNLNVCAYMYASVPVRAHAVTPTGPFCLLADAEGHCSATANTLLAAVERKPTHTKIYSNK